MKFRLVEFLQCPKHPAAMLRVREAHISRTFRSAGEVRVPVCRSGCGLLGNWFTDIPGDLPHEIILDCCRCLGTEIESGKVICPECGWEIAIDCGVLNSGMTSEGDATSPRKVLGRTGRKIESLLKLHGGDQALFLTGIPGKVMDKWSREGVERFQVDVDHDSMLEKRAASCASGQSLVHYLQGPFDPSMLRPHLYDALVTSLPLEQLFNSPDEIEHIPRMTRPSGKILLLLERNSEGSRSVTTDAKSLMCLLPESFSGMDSELHSTKDVDLLLLTRSESRGTAETRQPESHPNLHP